MIFISYRIADSHDTVARLDEDLVRELGPDNVFRDRTRLHGGDHWPDSIREAVKECQVMLVAIGADWQRAAYTDDERIGMLRLHDPEDWVRKEIALAFANEKRVIPLLLNDQKMPSKAWLDRCGLAELADCQFMRIRSDDYKSDVAKLIDHLRPIVQGIGGDDHSGDSNSNGSAKWRPFMPYALQPAPHFTGREKLLARLSEWTSDSQHANRVFALVAPGGTGKTAIVERVLSSLIDYSNAGVFVWSFYENQKSEVFFDQATRYFGGANGEPAGQLEALQEALGGDDAHILILDGLERSQADGTMGRRRGELDNPLLRRFLQWIAAGLGTSAKVLITSRFPLVDLSNWSANGYEEYALEDLENDAARAILRKWGVQGDDSRLDPLIEQVHSHALTVDVLGSYLGTYCNGDPSHAPSFDPEQLIQADPKTARLHRILSFYADRLSASERSLLGTLAAFPSGIQEGVLYELANKTEHTHESLTQSFELRKLLEQLRRLGLVFRYDLAGAIAYSAHPFLRGFFEQLIGVAEPATIHNSVRAILAEGLEDRPGDFPSHKTDLDRYEQLLEETRLAGLAEEAHDIWQKRLGGLSNIVGKLGQLPRALRILSSFSKRGTTDEGLAAIPQNIQEAVLVQWAVCSIRMGDFETAHALYDFLTRTVSSTSPQILMTSLYQFTGQWPNLLESIDASQDQYGGPILKAHARLLRADCEYRLGRVEHALAELDEILNTSYEEKLRVGLLAQGLDPDHTQLSLNHIKATFALETAIRSHPSDKILRTFWVELSGSDIISEEACLEIVEQIASQSGGIDQRVLCNVLAMRIAINQNNAEETISQAQMGLHLAETCGHGRWSLQLLLGRADAHMTLGQPEEALSQAEAALERSQLPEVQDAWGVADSLHAIGRARKELGDTTAAQAALQQAAEQRQNLRHPALEQTLKEIESLEGSS